MQSAEKKSAQLLISRIRRKCVTYYILVTYFDLNILLIPLD